MPEHNTPYQVVTDEILKLLEQGVVPWRKPWHNVGQPKSLASGKAYRGVNVFLLACKGAMAGYPNPYWVTFKQALERGGHVRKGEKGTPVVFWKVWETAAKNPETGEVEKKKLPVLRYYTVFNAAQCDALAVPAVEVPTIAFAPIERCEQVVAAYPRPPTIHLGGDRAAYTSALDEVSMPLPEFFLSPEHYYATLFHELIHATGHESRLHRQLGNAFGSSAYAKEELVAEMGSAFLCGQCGVEKPLLENAAAYLDHWVKVLKGDPKLVVVAASQAQKAADYALNVQGQEHENDAPEDGASAAPDPRLAAARQRGGR